MKIKKMQKILMSTKLKKGEITIFGEIEDRNKSLFVTLNYPHEIKKNDYLVVNNKLELNFFSKQTFISIFNLTKNGYFTFLLTL